ncbi:MAG: murein biosynthesis integral membrane protein MurJ [Eggerthellaceae bacterium]|nr:murein biosynthesis integral membrane protein MurJ [Eggerthellaceae bacterium]
MGEADNSILKSTGIMGMATLLSRATGLLRTWAMAFALGNTLITSAYQIANAMPNVIFDLVVGGILGTAFLPVYLLQKERLGREGADRFASNILNIVLVLLGVLVLLSIAFASFVVATQTFTRSNIDIINSTAVFFFRIFAVQLVFYGLSGVITGALNANRVYGVPALAPVFNNVCVIVSMFSYAFLSGINGQLALVVLAVGTTLGVVVQFGIQIPTLVKTGFTYTPRIDLKDPALKEALKIAVPTLIYIAGTLVSFSCRNAFSLYGGDHGPATLSYAWMWYQLPYGVVAVSLSTTYLTEMSKAVAQGDIDGLREYVKQGLRRTLFLIIPLAGLMFSLALPIMQIFRAGAFSQDDVAFVSNILALWVLSLPFYAGQMYLYRVFAALRQFMAFALVSCGFCVVQVILYAFLSRPFSLGLSGIMLADFIYYGLMFATMALILRKRIGSFDMMSIMSMCMRVLFATCVGAGIVTLLLFVLPLKPSILAGLLEIALCGALGTAVIVGLSKLFRVEEMDMAIDVLERLARKLAEKFPGFTERLEGKQGGRAAIGGSDGKSTVGAAGGLEAGGGSFAGAAFGFAGAPGEREIGSFQRLAGRLADMLSERFGDKHAAQAFEDELAHKLTGQTYEDKDSDIWAAEEPPATQAADTDSGIQADDGFLDVLVEGETLDEALNDIVPDIGDMAGGFSVDMADNLADSFSHDLADTGEAGRYSSYDDEDPFLPSDKVGKHAAPEDRYAAAGKHAAAEEEPVGRHAAPPIGKHAAPEVTDDYVVTGRHAR